MTYHFTQEYINVEFDVMYFGHRHIDLRFLFLEKVDFYSPIQIHRELDQCVSLWTYSSSIILRVIIHQFVDEPQLDHGDEPKFLGE